MRELIDIQFLLKDGASAKEFLDSLRAAALKSDGILGPYVDQFRLQGLIFSRCDSEQNNVSNAR